MEGKVSITITESPPRTTLGGTREEVNDMNEFQFDLQRFAAYTLTCTESNSSYTYTLTPDPAGGTEAKSTSSLSELFDTNISSEDTISVSGTIKIAGASQGETTTTIDFQGATLTGTTDGTGSFKPVFQVTNGNVTLKNGTIKSPLNSRYNSSYISK